MSARKSEAVRQRRNKPKPLSPAPPAPAQPPAFDGLDKLHDDAQAFWADIWGGPTAGRYSGADISGLRSLIHLIDARSRATSATEIRTLSTEIRQWSKSYGLTSVSRLALGWGDDDGTDDRAARTAVSTNAGTAKMSYAEKQEHKRESVKLAERLRAEGCVYFGIGMPNEPTLRASIGPGGVSSVMPIDPKILQKVGRPVASRAGWFRRYNAADQPPKGGWENPPAWSRLLVKAQRATAPDPRALMATQPGSINAAVHRNPGKTI